MSKVISYTPTENLMRIKMQKKRHFVVVEGEDDVPIYEIALRSIVLEKNITTEFEVMHAGGKESIKKFIGCYSRINFKAILDLDFDHKDQIVDERVHYLDVYSIENYFFSKIVITYLLASILKKKFSDVNQWLDMTDWYAEINAQCLLLLKYLFYYQKAHCGDREKWSTSFIVRNKNCWKIDPLKVSLVLDKIKTDIGVEDEVVEEYFRINFPTEECLSKVFPGKMVFISFYRYLKLYVEIGHKGVFGANYTNEGAFKNSSSSLLRFSPEFRKSIAPIIEFLGAKAA